MIMEKQQSYKTRVALSFEAKFVDLDRMRSPLEALTPPTAKVYEASSSMGSEEDSIILEEGASVDSSSETLAASPALLFNGGGGNDVACFPGASTILPEILNAGKLKWPTGLERSKTEQQRRNNILAEDAAQIFDDRISVQQKVIDVLHPGRANVSKVDVKKALETESVEAANKLVRGDKEHY